MCFTTYVVLLVVTVLSFLTSINTTFCSSNYVQGKLYTNCTGRGLVNTRTVYDHRCSVINLSDNEITIIRGNEFQDAGLRNLEEIILRNNRLQTIEKFAFNGLNELKRLDLSYNSIASLPADIFGNNFKLTFLNLSFNKFDTDVPLTAPQLQVLDLSECHLQQVPRRCINSLPNLRHLNMSANKIHRIAIEAFRHPHLESVQLTSNPFPCSYEVTKLIQWFFEAKIRFTSHCKYSGFETTQRPETSETIPNSNYIVPLKTLEKSMDYKKSTEDVKRYTYDDEFPLVQLILLCTNLTVTAIVLVVILCLFHKLRHKKNDRMEMMEIITEDEAPPPYI